MIVIMKKEAAEEQVEKVVDHIEKEGFKVSVDQGTERVVIGLKGSTRSLQEGTFTHCEGAKSVVRILSTCKLISRRFHPGNTVVSINEVKTGDSDFVTMAGPCSVEGLDQIKECARMARAGDAKILQGGAFKPRISPCTFQDLEEEGLKCIHQAAGEFGMKVIAEVMDKGHIDMVAEYSDILQIGAYNMQNFKLLSAVGKAGKPIGLKRGISGTINEWLSAAECIAVEDKSPVIFIERGIWTCETAIRNTFDLSAVPLMKKLTRFPMTVDPGHGTGIWDLVLPITRAGMTSGADDMVVEVHPDPADAWPDGPQSLNERTHPRMMKEVTIMKEAMEKIQTLD